jgi:hypothetical protein
VVQQEVRALAEDQLMLAAMAIVAMAVAFRCLYLPKKWRFCKACRILDSHEESS